jgi:hypothetical protein
LSPGTKVGAGLTFSGVHRTWLPVTTSVTVIIAFTDADQLAFLQEADDERRRRDGRNAA